MDPKKDNKWERGRTRQALHFGAHVRGGRAVGAEVRHWYHNSSKKILVHWSYSLLTVQQLLLVVYS